MKIAKEQGEYLYIHRTALLLSAREVAEELGVTPDFIYRIESGSRQIPKNRIVGFARAYKIPHGGLDMLVDSMIDDYAEKIKYWVKKGQGKIIEKNQKKVKKKV